MSLRATARQSDAPAFFASTVPCTETTFVSASAHVCAYAVDPAAAEHASASASAAAPVAFQGRVLQQFLSCISVAQYPHLVRELSHPKSQFVRKVFEKFHFQ